MPRKGHVPTREVLPDPLYHDVRVSKLINNVMLDGKKGLAQRIVYEALAMVNEKANTEGLEIFEKALENTMPQLEVKARRVGGANYQVPVEVRPERRQTLSLRWIVDFARKRSEKTMVERLAGELLDASNSTGGAFKRKEEMHRMAEANRAFAHYRW
ncbi:30S ribosomal protein S7 [Amygdalobacter nucleatus]|uniref:Small ribosomal subunit protein uS7 n=1 Tax=Amygdalobacter nucleatus TaxID=3029274 RepID=A0A133YEE5_9FIRM|nr:30S ribosomal protein S7 [Amygdalobacter nucleatus]KXB41580.1 ribosomal protein S7 [Amygdalobacter nucleatus]MDF0485582.1 30S ribosomal protein S7 [Amygdalobacter nucleatus]